MHTVHHPDLEVLLDTIQPKSVLLVDPNPDALPDRWMAKHPDCAVKRVQGDVLVQLEHLGQYDLGIVANTLEHLDQRTAGFILARMRDLNTRRFVALLPLGDGWSAHKSRWQTADLLGYGMTMMARYHVEEQPVMLFHYNIRSYKTTPEWFNARHWAHPAHWKP